MTPTTHTCRHPSGCNAPATHQAPRPATPEEAEQHWAGLEWNIRTSGTPEYIHPRTGDVTVADHRCDDHAHPGHLEALALADAANAYRAAMDALTAAAAPLNAEQLQQIADLVRSFGTTAG